MALMTTITQGWTRELGPFTLLANLVPVDLTGRTVKLMMRSSADIAFTEVTGDVRVDLDQVLNRGEVYYKPDASDFTALYSPYYLKWEVEDSTGVVYFPNADADTIVVKPLS